MKILITGTHFTPAVAVIEELKKYKDVRIVYVGRKSTLEGDNTQSQESRVLPALGVKFISIISGRLQREFSIYTISSLLKIPVGFIQAFCILLTEKPAVVLSFGGYVSMPVVFVGWLFSIPIIIHEQTLVYGLANRIGSFFADKIALSFPSEKINAKSIFTGNPIRNEVINVRPTHHQGINILITGGNQGSHVINLAVEESLDQLTKIASIIHVTGDNKYRDFERLKKIKKSKGLGGKYILGKWIGDGWGSILRKVDLVISRAGINTLSELSFLGIPALVIPIPYLYKRSLKTKFFKQAFKLVYQDEQNKNAEYFQKLGLVQILPQSALSAKALLKNVKMMLDELNNLNIKAKNAKKVIVPDAAKRLALETILLLKATYYA